MVSDNNQPTSEYHNYEDLTRIKGIGKVTQQWLRTTFNVRTYHDLAALGPEEIAERLKADGKITAPAQIEDWIAQARELSETKEWKTTATFVVLFEERTHEGKTESQTKAHFMEQDRTQVWPGVTPGAVTQWIESQLSIQPEPVPEPTRKSVPEPAPKVVQEMPPKPVPLVTEETTDTPDLVKEKLSHYIARVEELSQIKDRPVAPAAAPKAEASQKPTETADAGSHLESSYSQKLQQYMQTVQRLTEEVRSN